MNPFALTDEDEPRDIQAETRVEPSDQVRRATGLTRHPGSSVDGLPLRGTPYDSIFRDQSVVGRNEVDNGLAQSEVQSSLDSSKKTASNGSTDDLVPPDSEIPSMDTEMPSMDTESSGRTASGSMYLSFHPSNGASKPGSRRIHEGAAGNREIDLGSSVLERQDSRTEGPKWKGKARDIRSEVTEGDARGRSADPFTSENHRDNSASPPPDLLRSRSSSSSSAHHSETYSQRDDTFHDPHGKRDLLPVPVTTPQHARDPSKNHTDTLPGSVIFDAQALHDPPPSSRKPRTEKHRHRARRHRKHSDADDVETLNSPYAAEAFSDDPHAMLMSSQSSRAGERSSGGRQRRKKGKDPTAELSERERAMWGWANVVDLDGYLQEVSTCKGLPRFIG